MLMESYHDDTIIFDYLSTWNRQYGIMRWKYQYQSDDSIHGFNQYHFDIWFYMLRLNSLHLIDYKDNIYTACIITLI